MLDAALMRPGRFDVQLHVPLPDLASRKAILEVHTRGMPLDPTVDLQVIMPRYVHAHAIDLDCAGPPVIAPSRSGKVHNIFLYFPAGSGV